MFENIRVLAQNCIRIQTGDKVIYTDPFQMDGSPRDGDLILITHDHFDHFSPEDIEKAAGPDAVMVVPENMKKKAKGAAKLVKEILTVEPGGAYEICGVRFETIPSYNVSKNFHPKSAGWVAYILDLDIGRIFVAGDTDINEDNKKVVCDVALVPVGGTYTMTASEAAELVNLIQPKLAIPVHYGGIVGSKKDGEAFAKLVKKPVEVDVRMG
ncbi:MAG: MBL fold metallo-hydrolase [Lachnospiraceae bacterium]|nr:MBL fold metallo-hydrolase [Lachnospiraceae bacterium]